MLQKIRKEVDRFLNTFGGGGELAPCIIENPFEEIDEALAKGKLGLRVHYALPGQARGVQALQQLAETRGDIRGEENYLFSTRRYPSLASATALTSGAIAQGQYSFFQYAVGQSMGGAGFATATMATTGETNLFGTPSVVPQGQGFAIARESIIFNAEAKMSDVQQILDSGDLIYQTQSGQYTVYKGPSLGWPGGVGVVGASTNQNTETAHNGIADLRAVRASKMERVIKPQQQFAYIHNVGQTGRITDGSAYNLSAFTLMRVMLWGAMLTKQTA